MGWAFYITRGDAQSGMNYENACPEKGEGGCFEGSGFERNDLRMKGVGKSFIFMGVSNIGVR